MTKSTRVAFHRELAELDADVARVAAAVGDALGIVADALATGDHDAWAQAANGHARVDAEIRRCEERAFELLARQQPAAGDLRFLVTVGRLTHELERSSKLVSHLASLGANLRATLPDRLADLLARMAEDAHQLFQGAVEAYVRRDEASAEALDVWDDRVDELHSRFLGELFRSPPDLATTLDVVLVGRYVERVADHAVSIGQRIRYLVTGEL